MKIEHDSFTLTRRIAATPARVWRCWADPGLKRTWFVEGDGAEWVTEHYANDFRIGGTESGTFVLKSGPGAGRHENLTHYLDIVPGERLAFAYTMALDGRVHSASLATIIIEADGDGTLMRFTEQGAWFGETDGVKGRTAGWEHILDRVAAFAVEKQNA